MSFVIWHRGEAVIFDSKSETQAMNFIDEAIKEFPALQFTGWQETLQGRNLVTVISDFDEVYQYDKRQKWLMPKAEGRHGA